MRQKDLKPIKKSLIALLIFSSFMCFSCVGLFTIDEARSTYEEGLSLFNQGRFSEAVPYFQESIRLDNDFYEARLYLGRSYLNLHDYKSAVPALKKAFSLSPRKFQKETADLIIDALLGQASYELRQGNIQASMQSIREILESHPETKKVKEDISNVISAVAWELYRSGKARDAIKEYGEAIRVNPENITAYIGLARVLWKNGELLKAIEVAEKALSLDPDSKEALNVIKDLLRK